MRLSFFLLIALVAAGEPAAAQGAAPRIVNIVNFIRELEPRDPRITKDVLYQTVVQQVELMKQYNLGGTFLLQYDALIDPRYQELLKSLPKGTFEIGAWWELPQPLIEKAGLKWRGQYPWDWRPNVGFATGYTPAEREKLVDVYMHDFKAIFGYYPKSVASWFIDAHTLAYMYDKYGIVASANCKDQYGTDGYTLWGGYWNQAYYPSKVNAYMPAQHENQQIPVPIFRMLGSDPIRQYDNGLGNERQGVVTLEPVYRFGGGDSAWVDWFLRQFVDGEPLAFAYTQAGQENSFTWRSMARGLELQFPLIARLRDDHKVKVETLAGSGAWFKAHYKVTPATAVTYLKDLGARDKKTVWFDSRFYRVNFLWAGDSLRIRDIHLFDERVVEPYDKEPLTGNAAAFYTLPFVDGYLWSDRSTLAGIRFAKADGQPLTGGTPKVTSPAPGHLHIAWPLQTDSLTIDLDERTMVIRCKTPWYAELRTAPNAKLPFTTIKPYEVTATEDGFPYRVSTRLGTFSRPADAKDAAGATSPAGAALRITPEGGAVEMLFR
ncbi:MAG TPA: hypothetical protein VL547_07245 [Dinghuibacter sp.]|uniref:hypothetical protein n=1 Tax=Dinghuibacter sp. TaxID=2024697 RepID=UPI002C205ADE|nr:hypothetical protein [Dinghuibacter sp.]HTJ11802.1 hypothetical protein [Dinghuibacter sp.]